MGLKKKTFRAPIQLKADDEGAFRSVFATFNVVDHDGDVTVPGAFQNGQEVVIEGWNHDYGLPVGKGVIGSDAKQAWIDGRFFLDTTGGADHYKTLRNMEGLEQWSYTFTIEEGDRGEFDGERVHFLKELDVWGVAPVTRAAGIGTRTVALKALDLTEAELAYVKALCREAEQLSKEGAGDDAGASDDAGSTEGEAGNAGKPSISPGVAITEIEIMTLEE